MNCPPMSCGVSTQAVHAGYGSATLDDPMDSGGARYRRDCRGTSQRIASFGTCSLGQFRSIFTTYVGSRRAFGLTTCSRQTSRSIGAYTIPSRSRIAQTATCSTTRTPTCGKMARGDSAAGVTPIVRLLGSVPCRLRRGGNSTSRDQSAVGNGRPQLGSDAFGVALVGAWLGLVDYPWVVGGCAAALVGLLGDRM